MLGQLKLWGVPQLSDFIALSPWAVAHLPTDMDLLARYRTDKALAVLGAHTFSELPPGFETRASQSKPGQLVYLDLCLGAGTTAGGITDCWLIAYLKEVDVI